MDYIDIFCEFNKLGINYVIVGGLAAAIHGNPRMTFDIDIVIELTNKNINKTVQKLTKWGYEPKIPVDPINFADKTVREEWINQKNMKALNFFADEQTINEIDILIDCKSYETLKNNMNIYTIEGVSLPTACIDDLIDMKQKANRDIDKQDIENLKVLRDEKGN